MCVSVCRISREAAPAHHLLTDVVVSLPRPRKHASFLAADGSSGTPDSNYLWSSDTRACFCFDLINDLVN